MCMRRHIATMFVQNNSHAYCILEAGLEIESPLVAGWSRWTTIRP